MNDDLAKRIDALKAEINGATLPRQQQHPRPYHYVGYSQGGRQAVYYVSRSSPPQTVNGTAAEALAAMWQVPSIEECFRCSSWVTCSAVLQHFKAGDIVGERSFDDGSNYAKYTDGVVRRVMW